MAFGDPRKKICSHVECLGVTHTEPAPQHLGGTLALRATFRLDSPLKNPHTDPFQTPSKLGHPSYPNAPKFKSLKLP